MPLSRPEYAPAGLLALLTPQANTTVEPEISVLMPPGASWLNGRLLSGEASIIARLTDYMAGLDRAADQFGNAPTEALALACTGTGYVVGPEREDTQLEALSARLNMPVFSAATAVCDALDCLQARSVLLISPYDDALTRICIPYWQARGKQAETGFEVSECIGLTTGQGFHPIYAARSDSLDSVLAAHRPSVDAADAVVILGTGMPTLAPISRYRGATPLLSCMLCLGWQSAVALGAAANTRASLMAWSQGSEWLPRLSHRLGAARTCNTSPV